MSTNSEGTTERRGEGTEPQSDASPPGPSMNALPQASSGSDRAPNARENRKLPKVIIRAITLLASGEAKTQKEAADKAGITDVTLSKWLRTNRAQELRARVLRETLTAGKSQAAHVLMHLLHGAESEHVRKDIALKLLQQELGPDSVTNVNVGVQVGYVIDLSDGRSPSDAPVIDSNASEISDLGGADA